MSSAHRGGAPTVPAVHAEPERSSFWEAESAAHYVVEDIIQRGSALFYEHYLHNQEERLTSIELLTEVYEALGIALSEPDREVELEEDPSTLTLPEPSQLDTWATHVIPVKRRARMENNGSKRNVTAELVSPRSTSESSIRRTSPNAKKKVEDPTNGAEKVHYITQIVEIPTTPKTPKFAASPAQKEEQGEKVETWFETQLREEEEAAKANRELLAQIKKREQDERERFEQLSREMKGKEYQLDTDGSIVVVDAKLLDHLPPQSVELDVRVADPISSASGGRDVVAEKATKRGRTLSTSGNKNQQQGDNASTQKEFFKAPASYQPPLDATIKLAPGVEVRYGDVVRKGPEPIEDQRHMSKKEFQLHQKLLETNALSTSIIVQDQPPDTLALAGGSGLKGLTGSVVTTTTVRASGSGGSPRPKSPQSVTSNKRPPSSSGQVSDGLTGGRAQATRGQAQASEDLNYELINSPDWGQQHSGGKTWSPPRVPSRRARDVALTDSGGHARSEDQQPDSSRGVGGRLSPESGKRKQPRDRPYVHLAEPTRLPPPPIGATTGHGVFRQTEAKPDDLALTGKEGEKIRLQEKDTQPPEPERGFLPAITGQGNNKPDTTQRLTGNPNVKRSKGMVTERELKEAGTISIIKSDLTAKLLR